MQVPNVCLPLGYTGLASSYPHLPYKKKKYIFIHIYIYECTVTIPVTILQLFSGTDFLRRINVSDSIFVCQGETRPKAVSGVPSSSGFHAL